MKKFYKFRTLCGSEYTYYLIEFGNIIGVCNISEYVYDIYDLEDYEHIVLYHMIDRSCGVVCKIIAEYNGYVMYVDDYGVLHSERIGVFDRIYDMENLEFIEGL